MRINSQKYAKLLLEITQNKNEKDIIIEIKKFLNLLIQKNELKNYPEIINHYQKLWNKNEGILKTEITTARPLKPEISTYIENFIKKRTGAKKLEIKTKTNPDLISGTIIKYGDRILDNSLKTKINDLKTNMIK